MANTVLVHNQFKRLQYSLATELVNRSGSKISLEFHQKQKSKLQLPWKRNEQIDYTIQSKQSKNVQMMGAEEKKMVEWSNSCNGLAFFSNSKSCWCWCCCYFFFLLKHKFLLRLKYPCLCNNFPYPVLTIEFWLSSSHQNYYLLDIFFPYLDIRISFFQPIPHFRLIGTHTFVLRYCFFNLFFGIETIENIQISFFFEAKTF